MAYILAAHTDKMIIIDFTWASPAHSPNVRSCRDPRTFLRPEVTERS
jgi:hypothetical protein